MVARNIEYHTGNEEGLEEFRDNYGSYGHIGRFRVLLECGSEYHKKFESGGDRRPWQELSADEFRRRFTLPTDRIIFSVKEIKQASVSDEDGRHYDLNVLLTEMKDYDGEKYDFIFLEHSSELGNLRLCSLRDGNVNISNGISSNGDSTLSIYLTAKQAIVWSFRGELEDILKSAI